MRRSTKCMLVVSALIAAACSATDGKVGIGGDCPAGKTCDTNPVNDGDDSDSDEDEGATDSDQEDEDEDEDMSGDGDGDGDGDADRDAGPAPIGDECKPEDIIPEGCVPAVNSEATLDLCDGSDNDCDGQIDEGCVCVPGTVQRCFAGPPGRRHVGGCDDGQQTCVGTEFGKWGECTGGIVPTDEVCDSLDNDCNGCIDEIDGCTPDLACPAPGDPRIPDGKPFSNYPLNGAEFVSNVSSVVSWEWTVTGTPCDTMFLAIPGSTASATNDQLSFTLSGERTANANIKFTLSGDYTVTMKVKLQDGSEIECTWVVHVRAPGVRVELCWDTTGPTASAPIDVDLHLGKHGTTGRWFDPTDCYYSNCKNYTFSTPPAWGYAASPATACDVTTTGSTQCNNPRLDIDNIYEITKYKPENINVDSPLNNDKFRVMIHHYSVTQTFESHPLVNVYCGGELRGTFGAAPDIVTGFRDGGGNNGGDMWRVVDVTAQVSGGVTDNCMLEPLSMGGTPWVTTGDSTF